jgi:hypothetical protein
LCGGISKKNPGSLLVQFFFPLFSSSGDANGVKDYVSLRKSRFYLRIGECKPGEFLHV